MPNAAVFGVIADPAFPVTPSIIADLRATARTLGRQLVVVYARTDSDLEMAFATLSQQRVGAVMFGDSTFYSRRTEQLPALAARHALPAIYPLREFALASGLMTYGSSSVDLYHQVGVYTGRILKGEKSADLPVERATRIQLTLNLKTAKALGIEFPTSLLVRADEVIE
jgi:putative tryptophan/tyrosine transport system substrate-binding protein